MASSAGSSSSKQRTTNVDLDLFLTAVESKLRGPFSSLDLTKTVTTPALRGGENVSERDYLEQISQILSKSDKICQMRILIGLLGLDPDDKNNGDIDEVVYAIVRQAQGNGEGEDNDRNNEERLLHRYDDWVRVIAGLIQGIMFQEEVADAKDDDNDDDDEHVGPRRLRQCYGEEAKKIMDKTCFDIIKKIEKVIQKTTTQQNKEEQRTAAAEKTNGSSSNGHAKDPSALSLWNVDFDPCMAPYRYSLLNPPLLKEAIPDSMKPNPHFTVNEDAPILKLDYKLEIERAREEAEHSMQKQSLLRSTTDNNHSNNRPAAAAAPIAYMPGMNRKKRPAEENGTTSTTGVKKKPERPKTSMFLTAKKPPGVAGGRGAGGGIKPRTTGLQARKTPLDRLVGKSRQIQTTPAATTAAGRGRGGRGGLGAASLGGGSRLLAPGGRALKATAARGAVASARSKMKMIDDDEASDLAKQQQPEPGGPLSRAAGLKRKLASTSKPPVKPTVQKKSKSTPSSSSTSQPNAHRGDDEEDDNGEDDDVQKTHASTAAANTDSGKQNQAASRWNIENDDDDDDDDDEEDGKPNQATATQAGNDNNNNDDDDDDDASPLDANRLAAAALSKYQLERNKDKQTAANPSRNATNHETTASALAAAALSKYQSTLAAGSATAPPAAAAAAAAAAPRQLNWQELLETKSNLLTEMDRKRVQLFFEARQNPTPSERIHKMKLHEERIMDPNTGKPLSKETYYLELNYDNFTSKQSKKVKRY